MSYDDSQAESRPLRLEERDPRNSLLLHGVTRVASLKEAVCERFCENLDGVFPPEGCQARPAGRALPPATPAAPTPVIHAT